MVHFSRIGSCLYSSDGCAFATILVPLFVGGEHTHDDIGTGDRVSDLWIECADAEFYS
jgi:hypothetical protein